MPSLWALTYSVHEIHNMVCVSKRFTFGELCNLLQGPSLSLGKKVSVNSLSTILDNIGIKLTDEELKALTQNLPIDGKQVLGYYG